MKIVHKETGEDFTSLIYRQMKGELTREEVIKLAGLDPIEEEKHYQERLQANKNPLYV